MDTPAGPTPRVRTRLSPRDLFETATIRFGYGRYDYKVVPGLYCVGNPTPDCPVIVTANYKLTFDMVRRELNGQNAWLLVADTRGINVWCAAGKALFGTEEIVLSVRSARLDTVVSHRTLILPQLGATGVAAHTVKKHSGFSVCYGPVRAADLPRFIENDNQADETMRSVTFTLRERAELVSVELFILGKPLIFILLAAFLLSGIGPDVFSLAAAWTRGLAAACATALGIVAGSVAVPILLPRLPWKRFALKGAVTGMVAALGTIFLFYSQLGIGELLALSLWTTGTSSYLALNFTGSTPFTSPSGVENEMRTTLPILIVTALAAIIIWLAAPFTG